MEHSPSKRYDESYRSRHSWVNAPARHLTGSRSGKIQGLETMDRIRNSFVFDRSIIWIVLVAFGFSPPALGQHFHEELAIGRVDELSQVRWKGPILLTPRYNHAMSYDSARGVTVLFGGYRYGNYDGGDFIGETWEFDGTKWTLRSTVGPSPRFAHGMVYDSRRAVTVLFGGYTDSQFDGETWEWDGCTWVLRSSAGPAPRFGHAMSYDSARGVTVLFGGRSGSTTFGSTWEWDGSTWTLRSTIGPSPRTTHGMAYDVNRGVTVLFGGSGNGDTWEWNGITWTLRSASGPSARSLLAMSYDSLRAVTVLFGGYHSTQSYGDTWEWNGSTWSLRSTGGPSPRSDHAMVYDIGRGESVLFAGVIGTPPSQGAIVVADTWSWNGDIWTQRSPSPAIPSPRNRHAMAYDSSQNVTVLFGGNTGDSFLPSSETWEWNGTIWSLQSSSGPAGRQRHAMAYDSSRNKTVMFGGSSDSGVANGETWEWDGSSWLFRTNVGPSPRWAHAMAYDADRGVTVLFGGRTEEFPNISDETWEWDGTVWTMRTATGPPPRLGHAMAYDSGRAVIVLTGGFQYDNGNYGYSEDTWEWDGNAWTLRANNGFRPGTGVAMAYDSGRGVTMLFGGDHNFNNLTWEWDGNSWMSTLRRDKVSPASTWDGSTCTPSFTGPSRRNEHAMVYDTARGSIVLFGGIENSGKFKWDTWEYGAP